MIPCEPKITSCEKRVFHTSASFRAWSTLTSLLSSLLVLSMASRAVVKSPLVSSLITSSRSSSYSEAERASGHKDIKIWRRLTNGIMTAVVTAVCWRLTVPVCVWLWCCTVSEFTAQANTYALTNKRITEWLQTFFKDPSCFHNLFMCSSRQKLHQDILVCAQTLSE